MLAKRTLLIILIAVGLGAWYATYKYDRNLSGVSKDETEFMVKRAVSFIKMQGESGAYSEISNRAGRFVDRDLYVVVYTMEGRVLAHGANSKMIGKTLIDLTDIDGKTFIKERIELAKTKTSFWQTYKFTNPENKRIEPKLTYCERLNQTIVCGGFYPES